MKSCLGLVAAAAILGSAAVLHAAENDNVPVELSVAVERGDSRAQTELAVRYEQADGVPRDFLKANELYCKAARQGHAEAQFKLGWVYANGRSVTRDSGVAAALFRMAAAQGHEHAASLLPYVRSDPGTVLPVCLVDRPVQAGAKPPEAEPEAAELPSNRTEIENLVRQLAPRYAVDSKLALAMIAVESAFNPLAVSPKKAQGLMQLIPETAKRFGVSKVFDAAENIKGGLAYVRWLLAFFEGDVSLVLAAYNAGERAVEKYRGVPPYAETRDYVRKITGNYKDAFHPFEAGVVEPSPVLARIKAARR